VGTTPEESGTTTTSTEPYPGHREPSPGPPDFVVNQGADQGADQRPPAVGPPGPDPQDRVRAEGRQALRAARRQRRRISIGCAVLVAVCMAITVLIVDLARDRTSGPQVVLPSASAVPFGSHPSPSPHPPRPLAP
jgi:hypothetical protein